MKMAYKPLATRIPEEMEKQLTEYMESEGTDKSTAARKILEKGIAEWRKERALGLLGQGRITFAKAAEIAAVSLWEMADLVKQKRIEWVHITPEDIEREFKLAQKSSKRPQ
ncbi:MAG: UPF0175 family protein [Methanocellales archaeon]|nr:UPF0175 family protein [Methanocellales archaeon]